MKSTKIKTQRSYFGALKTGDLFYRQFEKVSDNEFRPTEGAYRRHKISDPQTKIFISGLQSAGKEKGEILLYGRYVTFQNTPLKETFWLLCTKCSEGFYQVQKRTYKENDQYTVALKTN